MNRRLIGSIWVAAIIVAIIAMMSIPLPAKATIIDSRTFSGTQCDGTANGCFGFTYTLTVDDLGNLADGTYSATLNIAGTYTGSTMTYIGAVDIKAGDVSSPVTLTAAPGGTAGWTTLYTSGQAAVNCLNGSGGFLCSYDTGTNTLAPIDAGAVNYTWTWNFSLTGDYAFGHLGANLTVADDGSGGSCNSPNATPDDCLQDGQNVSIAGGGTTRVAEPSALLLLGIGMLAIRRIVKR